MNISRRDRGWPPYGEIFFPAWTCLVISLFVVTGCVTSPPPAGENVTGIITIPPTPEGISPSTPSLIGVTWELVAFESGRFAQESVTPGSNAYARFEQDGIIHGSTGCNQYCARFNLSGLRLSIDRPERTRTICASPSGILSQEVQFLLNMERVWTYRIEGDLLSLQDDRGRGVLLFRQCGVPDHASPLSNRSWYLTHLHDEQGTLAPVSNGFSGIATFRAGTLAGFVGCNCYQASYQEHGAGLRIGIPTTSGTRCADEQLRLEELRYYSSLGEVAGYASGDDSLVMVDRHGEPLMEFSSLPRH